MSTEAVTDQARSQELLCLLRSKNRCLERFLEVTEEFWSAAETGHLDGLSVFESRRDATLKAIELFDRKIDETSALLRPEERDPSLADEARILIEAREVLVHRILGLDLKIIGRIEAERTRLLQDIGHTRRARDTLAKFKSGAGAEGGEELDRTL